MRIEQALEKYIVQLQGNGRSEHTVAQVRRHVRLFEAWLEAEGESTELARIDHQALAVDEHLGLAGRRLDHDGPLEDCGDPDAPTIDFG